MSQAHTVQSTSSDDTLPLGWLLALSAARAPDEVATAISALLQRQPGCLGADISWGLETASRSAAAGEAWLRRAMETDSPCWHADGRQVALRLCQQPKPGLLVLQLQEGVDAAAVLDRLTPLLQLAGQQLQRALEWHGLQHSHQQLERSETLQHALFAISDLAGSELDMPDMLRGIHAIVSTLMYAKNFFIVMRDRERETIRFLYYVDVEQPAPPLAEMEMPLSAIEHTLTWYVVCDGKARMGNGEELRNQVVGPVTLLGPDSHDWLGVPMLRDGTPVGALVVQSYQPDIEFTDEDMTLLQFVGSHILTTLERKQGHHELEQRVQLRTAQLAEANQGLQLEVAERQRAEHLQAALFQIAQLATADIGQDSFYRHVHTVVGELLNVENFYIALVTDDRQRLSFPYAVNADKQRPPERVLGRGLSEYVLRHGRALHVDREQIRQLELSGEIVPQRVGLPAMWWLGVPLSVGEEVIGLVAVQSYIPSVTYTAADLELLSFVASQIANSLTRRRAAQSLKQANVQLEQRVEERTQELRKEIIERERMQDQLRHQVMHDALTGLPNRDYLRDRIERILVGLQQAEDAHFALLYLDIDRFKIINDSLGHLAGDEVLKAVAVRLASCVRHPDLVARLSGDEFAILLEHLDDSSLASQVAERVMDALTAPMVVAGKELEVTASIGIAIGSGSHQAVDELLRDADIALYRAKQLGRKRFEVFDETLARNMVDVLAMEGDLRAALKQGQFAPYLQPICQLDSGKIVGYEALIRWNHPERGVLLPDEFLRIAEESGLVEAIDWHMFEHSCRLLKQHERSDTFMTINVSALHLRRTDFDVRLIELLAHCDLPPSRLIVEVTEGALLDNPESVRATLDRLRTAGVGAALDDFGTGYSSLSYLHSLPLGTLKIDRAFVHELDKGSSASSTTVVAAILALARALNIQVVAEGIETEVQRRALLAMGCVLGQGYLLGHPLPALHWQRQNEASTNA